MKLIQTIENVALKIEKFASNFDFFARMAKAFGVGMNAFNDALLSRNTQALKQYQDARNNENKEV